MLAPMGKRQRRAARAARNGEPTQRPDSRANGPQGSSRPRPSGGTAGGVNDADVERSVWQAVAAVHSRTPLRESHFEAVAAHGRVAVRISQQLLMQAAAALGERGWADVDIRHVAARRLSSVHAEAISDGSLPGPRVLDAVTVLIELLALVTTLPEVAAAGRSDAEDTKLSGLDPRILHRVRALLRKAESTEFSEEAEALTTKAQELIARHAIDAVALGAPDQAPITRRVHLDDPYRDAKALLLDRVAAANRCTCVFAQPFGWSDVFGFPGDLDAVELLTSSLLAQATQAMTREGARFDAAGRSRTRSFRRAFLVGFATRIGQRLQHATDASVAAAGATHGSLLPALAARDERVHQLRAETYPQIVSRSTRISNGSGWAAGQAAAEVADLSLAAGAVREGSG